MSIEIKNFVYHCLDKSSAYLRLAQDSLEDLAERADVPKPIRDRARKIASALSLDVNEASLIYRDAEDCFSE